MKGRKKLFSLVGLLSVLLIIPLAFSLGGVDIPRLLFGGSPTSSMVGPLASTSTVFVDPSMNVTDYEDAVHNVTIGSTVTFHINISGVTDLFAWQHNVSWDPSILNVSRVIQGEFLARSANLTSSEILGFVINYTGSVVAAEAIMANTTGITGGGRLVTIEFEIVGYGWTYLNITAGGNLPTMLLNSTGDILTYDRQLVPIFSAHGYFRNVIYGDMTDDSLVGVGPPDGDIDGFDLGVFSDNFGRS